MRCWIAGNGRRSVSMDQSRLFRIAKPDSEGLTLDASLLELETIGRVHFMCNEQEWLRKSKRHFRLGQSNIDNHRTA